MAQRVVAFQPAPGPDQQPEPLIETGTDLARRIDAIREAANSMASGIPSRRWHVSTTAAASSAVATEKREATLRARSTNRLTAEESMPARTSSEGTSHNCSSATPNPSRLVANTLTVAECARIASTRSAAASRTCSQLSNTNKPDPALQCGGHTVIQALPRLVGDAQHRGHRVRHRCGISDGCKFENPNAVGELIGQLCRNF